MNIKLLISAIFGFSALGGGVAGCCYYFKPENSKDTQKNDNVSNTPENPTDQVGSAIKVQPNSPATPPNKSPSDSTSESQGDTPALQAPSASQLPVSGPEPAVLGTDVVTVATSESGN